MEGDGDETIDFSGKWSCLQGGIGERAEQAPKLGSSIFEREYHFPKGPGVGAGAGDLVKMKGCALAVTAGVIG